MFSHGIVISSEHGSYSKFPTNPRHRDIKILTVGERDMETLGLLHEEEVGLVPSLGRASPILRKNP